jgi:primosomal protein N' (replication factor Y)
VVRLEIRDKNTKTAEKKAGVYSTALQGWIEKEGFQSTRLVGPTPAYFSRIRGEWRWQILVKGPNPLQLIRDHHPGSEWIVEVDPPVIL